MIGAAHLGAWAIIGLGVDVVAGVMIGYPGLAMGAGAIAGVAVGLIQARRARSGEDSE